MTQSFEPCEGGCTCGQVRYRVKSAPMIVHCCHCSWCQRQSGSAFAINALLETDRVDVLAGDVEDLEMPSPSGKGQTIARCPDCRVAVWSNYFMGGLKQHIRFIRVGSLDQPDRMPPDVHIFTISKQAWVTLPAGAPSAEHFYDPNQIWSLENLQRLAPLEKAAGIDTPWRNRWLPKA